MRALKLVAHPIHTKSCECGPCVNRRVSEYLERMNDRSRRIPKPGCTVYVGEYWRHQRNHMKKNPKTLAALEAALAQLRRKPPR